MSDTIRPCIHGENPVLDFRPKETVLTLIFFSFVIVSGIDLALDFSEGTDFTHIAQEAVVLTLSLIALAWLLFGLRRRAIEIKKLRDELSNAIKPSPLPKKYVLEAKANLSHVISQQFEDWHLSDSEKDVGWLLLKGLSLKEISALRNTLEKTVRQQASAIYKKAGLNGRHAFSAWFIEDVL
jgi:DNA-binding CsgD family transcriptional regulator